MLFCLRVRARAVDERVDNNTLFSHVMIAMSAYFANVFSHILLLSNSCTSSSMLVADRDLAPMSNALRVMVPRDSLGVCSGRI